MCTFSFVPGFIAKIWNPSILALYFQKLSGPPLKDSEDNNREKLLLCPVQAVKKNLGRTRSVLPSVDTLFSQRKE